MEKRSHLKRIGTVWESHPCYFVTTCIYGRRTILNQPAVHDVLRKHWEMSLDLYGWAIGSYTLMPDHVHFFCTDASQTTTLSRMVGAWKQWTAKELCRLLDIEAPFWQKEFFDHLLRSNESYSEKREYVHANPVRAGLVQNADQWPYCGHIHYM